MSNNNQIVAVYREREEKTGRTGSWNFREMMTSIYHPNRISVEDFILMISNMKTNKSFMENMKALDLEDTYPEVWMELYTKWMELNP
jgi:hypothetical protein